MSVICETCNWEYVFLIKYGSTTTVVQPLNFLETSIVYEKEKDQVFYRTKFQGELTFGGQKLKDDFNLLWAYEQADPCARLDFMIYRNGVMWWQGYFATNEGKWDLDACTFSVTPNTYDKYSLWQDEGELEWNILDVAAMTDDIYCGSYVYNDSPTTNNIFRLFWDVVEFIVGKVYTTASVESILFTSITDYVTLLPNRNLYLTIAAKSDVKKPAASNPATVANMSFNELMHIFKMFNCYWQYDADLDQIRIEHISYFNHNTGIDLRTQNIARGSNKYRYTKETMPKYEKWYPMEAVGYDFVYGRIWYDSACVNQDKDSNTWEYRNRVTTDIEMIQSADYVDGVSNDGFVLLANYKVGADYHTYLAPGLVDSTLKYNQYLSSSYLTYAYHRHDRVLNEGYVNNDSILTTFPSIKPNKQQEINAIVCEAIDPEDGLITELGMDYFDDLPGYVEKATFKPSGEMNFVLLYGEAETDNPGISTLDKAINVTVDGLDLIIELSEPNIYDVYFSVWTNGDNCDQYVITAGKMYQEEVITQVNPVVSTKWNFTHGSLTGWIKTVDGSTTFDTCTDGDCSSGAPVPPAIPDVPGMVGIGQASTCGPLGVSWTPEVGASYYVLQRNPDYGGNDSYVTVYSGVATSFDDYDAGVQDGVLFTYKAAAGNISGLSAFSAEDTFTASC